MSLCGLGGVLSARRTASSRRRAISASVSWSVCCCRGCRVMSSNPTPSPPQWPTYDINSIPDHVHAIGVLSVNYNNLEHQLLELYRLYCDAPSDVASFIFERLSSTEQKLGFLVFLLDRRKTLDRKIYDGLMAFSYAYKICAKNRGFIIHSRVNASFGDGVLMLTKRTRARGAEMHRDVDLEMIRQVADEIHTWHRYAHHVIFYVSRKRRARQKKYQHPDIKLVGPTTLPQIPPPPIDLESLYRDPLDKLKLPRQPSRR
jgi:hypothetical protein